MIETFYLSDEELADITGYTRRADQIGWLTRNKWTFALSAVSKPVVSRRHAEIMLGGIVETSAPPKVSEWKPNVALHRAREMHLAEASMKEAA